MLVSVVVSTVVVQSAAPIEMSSVLGTLLLEADGDGSEDGTGDGPAGAGTMWLLFSRLSGSSRGAPVTIAPAGCTGDSLL